MDFMLNSKIIIEAGTALIGALLNTPIIFGLLSGFGL